MFRVVWGRFCKRSQISIDLAMTYMIMNLYHWEAQSLGILAKLLENFHQEHLRMSSLQFLGGSLWDIFFLENTKITCFQKKHSHPPKNIPFQHRKTRVFESDLCCSNVEETSGRFLSRFGGPIDSWHPRPSLMKDGSSEEKANLQQPCCFKGPTFLLQATNFRVDFG